MVGRFIVEPWLASEMAPMLVRTKISHIHTEWAKKATSDATPRRVFINQVFLVEHTQELIKRYGGNMTGIYETGLYITISCQVYG